MEAMKVMENNNEEEEMRYKSTEKVEFPPMKVKFRGHLWTLQKARDQLSIYLNILGFGKGGTRKFKEAADEPDSWPDEHAFESFEHPSYANMATINDVIESLLQYHGFDANTHPFTIEEPKTPPPKRAKKAKKRVVIAEEQESDDPNDNSINRELDDVEAGPSGLMKLCGKTISEKEKVSWNWMV